MSDAASTTDNGLPRHIAIIMDGNNRWARARKLTSVAGHRAGAEAAREVINSCVDQQIGYLTLFAFSSENWRRPAREVSGLMALFLSVLKRKEVRLLHERGVRLRFIGNRSNFSARLRRGMDEVEALTANNGGTCVNVAADYGGRWDIAHACRQIAEAACGGELDPASIDESTLQQYIALGDQPAPDLCIRTGGEQRISNFLLWQMAYTELYFSPHLWPDFDRPALQQALDDFAGRQRRFGLQPVGNGGDCA